MKFVGATSLDLHHYCHQTMQPTIVPELVDLSMAANAGKVAGMSPQIDRLTNIRLSLPNQPGTLSFHHEEKSPTE